MLSGSPGQRSPRGLPKVWALGVLLVLGTLASPGQAADLSCGAGNTACLIAAIRTANGLTEPSTIRLASGIYTLTAVDNDTEGPNGLPSVTRTLSIQGSGAEATIIERAADAPAFRLVHVAPSGALTLEGVTLRGGLNGRPGGGILNNGGRVTFSHSRLTGNHAVGDAYGGGLFNNGGTLILTSSTVADNRVDGETLAGGGGLATDGGVVTITTSAIVDNHASALNSSGGGGFAQVLVGPLSLVGPQPASVDIVNSTIARNTVAARFFGNGGGLMTGQGRWTIMSSTIAGNGGFSGFGAAGGIWASGPVSVQNTIVAQNAGVPQNAGGPDCVGSILSLGHNLIGDLSFCTIALQPNDRTGSPGLAIYTDDGVAGHAHWPLLATSQAIGGGDASTCPPTDQPGRPRPGRCDIGAVEFVPVADPLDDFVRGFYRHALGREPLPAEVAGWLSFLQGNPTLASARVMTHAFFDGTEYRARAFTPDSHVTALYQAILGRDREPQGSDGWTRLVQDRLNAVPRVFIGSPEFQAIWPCCRDGSAVRPQVARLYDKLLSQPSGTSPVDEAFVSNLLTNCGLPGVDIESLVNSFLFSEQYAGEPRTLAAHITNLYRALLVREPRPDEVGGWIDYVTPPFIEDQFIDSPEFAARWRQLVS